jgi:hypothetical protein
VVATVLCRCSSRVAHLSPNGTITIALGPRRKRPSHGQTRLILIATGPCCYFGPQKISAPVRYLARVVYHLRTLELYRPTYNPLEPVHTVKRIKAASGSDCF